jgi:membrane protease YdiL (CAAX protease family)
MELDSKIRLRDGLLATESHARRLLFVVYGILLTLFSVICLAELYTFAGRYIPLAWAAAASVNSLILIGIFIYFGFKVPIPGGPFLNDRLQRVVLELGKRPILSFAPALLVTIVCLAAAGTSRLFGTPETDTVSGFQVAWVTWIPIVEEIVFRVGLGNFLRRFLGFGLGSYFSVLAFSVTHSLPTISRVAHLEFSAPLGPLLLGIFCELIYVSSGKITPAIALHSACNGTVVIFSLLDARWLDWLARLYI